MSPKAQPNDPEFVVRRFQRWARFNAVQAVGVAVALLVTIIVLSTRVQPNAFRLIAILLGVGAVMFVVIGVFSWRKAAAWAGMAAIPTTRSPDQLIVSQVALLRGQQHVSGRAPDAEPGVHTATVVVQPRDGGGRIPPGDTVQIWASESKPKSIQLVHSANTGWWIGVRYVRVKPR